MIYMSEAIVVAIITGVFAFAGTFISVYSSAKKTSHEIDVRQAVTDEKISELTREVREHNDFARRVPVLEEQMKVANHRIADLEKKGE